MSMKTLFQDEQYCKDEILRIREAFGNKNSFNTATIDASRYSLGFMYLYCPERLQPLVESTLDELSRREQFLLFGR